MAATSRKIKPKTNGSISASDIEANITQVKEDLAALSNTLATYGKDKVSSAKGDAIVKSEEFVKTSEKAIAEMTRQVNDLGGKVEKRVREKPLQSLAIAAGIGALLALVSRR